MRHLIIIFLAALAAIGAKAQPKYCLSYADFQADRWLPLDTLIIEEASSHAQVNWGVGQFKLRSRDKAVNKLLRKAVFAVADGDTLLVNCKKLQIDNQVLGKGYTQAFRFNGNQLCFAAFQSRDDMNGAMLFGGFFGGAIGGAITAAIANEHNLKNMACYVTKIEFRSGQVKAVLIDDALMHSLLAGDEQLLATYLKPKEKVRNRATYVLPILEQAGLITHQTPVQPAP